MIEDPAPDGGPPPAIPIVFGPEELQLFGLYHAPDPKIACATGVVLCNPLGHEAMSAHRSYRNLAERLAAAGFHALRFDYHGTGDSSGTGDEPDRVRAWRDSIGAAIDELRAITGVRAINLFGVRFGATLAALSAAERRDVEGLVLWAPCVSGRAYVRELRAFGLIKGHEARGAQTAPREGYEEVAGYLYAQSTMQALSEIDLMAQTERIALRALVLPRDDLPGREEPFTAHLEATSVEAIFRAEPGYAGMMLDPQDTVVPHATLDRIVDWTRERRETIARFEAEGSAPSNVLTASSHATGHPVHEESLTFGEGDRLVGILSEAVAGPMSRRRPAVLFLNVGANHRVGPNRMYVTLARDLAARGYLAFRFDVAGLGDSRAADERLENRLFSLESVSDVREAMTLLSRIRGVERAVLVGICSGAYLAYQAALADPRVAGQILINPATFEWNEGDSLELLTRKSYKSTRYYLGEILDRRVWAQMIRGDIDLRGIAGALRERFVTRASAGLEEAMARVRGRPAPRTEVERAFREMSDRGIESLLVFSSTDGGLDMIEEHLGRDARKIRGSANTRLAIVEGADHTFSFAETRSEVCALIASFVEGAFPASKRHYA